MQFLVALFALFSTPALADVKGYACMGTEPFFSLKVQGQNLKLETPDGLNSQMAVTGPITPHGVPEGAVAVYKSKENDVVVSIVYGKCTDGMSDKEYPYHLVYSKDEHALYGCCEQQAQD